MITVTREKSIPPYTVCLSHTFDDIERLIPFEEATFAELSDALLTIAQLRENYPGVEFEIQDNDMNIVV